MQPAPLSAGDRRALTGCPSPGLSAALRMWITMDQRGRGGTRQPWMQIGFLLAAHFAQAAIGKLL